MRCWNCAVMDGCKWDLLMEMERRGDQYRAFFFSFFFFRFIVFCNQKRKMSSFQTNNRPQNSQSDWKVCGEMMCEYSNSMFCFAVAAEQRKQQKNWVMNRRKAFFRASAGIECSCSVLLSVKGHPDSEQDCCITVLAIDFLVLASALHYTQINDESRVLPMLF